MAYESRDQAQSFAGWLFSGLMVAVFAGLVGTACTAAQRAALKADEAIVQSDAHAGASTLLGLVATAEAHPELVGYVLTFVDALAAKQGAAAPQWLADVHAALAAGSLEQAHAVLDTVITATAPSTP